MSKQKKRKRQDRKKKHLDFFNMTDEEEIKYREEAFNSGTVPWYNDYDSEEMLKQLFEGKVSFPLN